MERGAIQTLVVISVIVILGALGSLALLVVGSGSKESGTEEDEVEVTESDEAFAGTKTIATQYGELTLSYKSGTATLLGALNRSTPCISWEVSVEGSSDIFEKEKVFTLKRQGAEKICIQILGEPQSIFVTTTASPITEYTIVIEGETASEGRIVEVSPAFQEDILRKGVLRGAVSIGPICPVETIPPREECKTPPEMYRRVGIIIRNSSGAEILRTTAGEDARFYAALFPGQYTVQVETDIGIRGSNNRSYTVNILEGQTSNLNINIDTGIR